MGPGPGARVKGFHLRTGGPGGPGFISVCPAPGGPFIMGHGSWVMGPGHGSWVMGHGSFRTNRSLLGSFHAVSAESAKSGQFRPFRFRSRFDPGFGPVSAMRLTSEYMWTVYLLPSSDNRSGRFRN